MTRTPQQYVAGLVDDAAACAPRPVPATALATLLRDIEAATVPGRGPVSTEPLRLATGVLAERLLARDPGAPPLWRGPYRSPRRGLLLLGAPTAVAATKAANGLRALDPTRPDRVVVLVRSLEETLADAWADQVWTDADLTWSGFVAKTVARDRMPEGTLSPATLTGWSERVGPDRVHVVTTDGPVAGIGSAALRVVHPPLHAAALEVVRVTSATLGVIALPDRHQRVLDGVLRPLLAAEEGPAPQVGPGQVPWLERRAASLSAALQASGCVVHGSPVVAARGSGSVVVPESDEQRPTVLATAVRALLATCEESA